MNEFLIPVRLDKMVGEYVFRMLEAETDEECARLALKLKRIKNAVTAFGACSVTFITTSLGTDAGECFREGEVNLWMNQLERAEAFYNNTSS